MKIYFITERLDNKLIYILKQFLDFSTLDIQIEIRKFTDQEVGEEKKIYYLTDFRKVEKGQGVFIHSSRDWDTAGAQKINHNYKGRDFLVWKDFLREEPFIKNDGQRTYLNFDLFAQAFYQLSCYQEFVLEAEGKRANSNAGKIPADKDILQSPNVNMLFLILEGLIADIFGIERAEKNRYPSGKQFAVLLTHDLDAVKKTFKGRVKHIFHGLNRAARLTRSGKFSKVPEELGRTFYKFFGSARYDNLAYLGALEEKEGFKSSLNIYVMNKKNKAGFSNWFYNPDYNISKDAALAEEVKNSAGKYFELGIHGSFSSACDSALLGQEIKSLEEVTQRKVSGGRQHFLDYSVSRTPRVFQDAGLEYDTTVGFRDINGFRAGACLPYYLYSLGSDSSTGVLEIPLAIMDGVLFDRQEGAREIAWQETEAILEKVKNARGCCSVVWHGHVFNNPDYPYWEEIYLMLIAWVKDNGGALLGPGELNKFWREKKQGRLINA